MLSTTNPSGFLLIDKPAGMSSFDVIRHLRKQTGIRTFGHAGTLDPFATGLLLLAVNKYTRLLSLLEFADKTYIATLILGTETSTGDPEGEIINTSERIVTKADFLKLKPKVLQINSLKPPIHSAIKIDGKRSYTRARADEDFVLPDREAHVYEFDLLEFDYPQAVYSCRVSKGTYIRSLSQWLAEQLGTVGYTKELKRTAIGKISLDKAIRLSDITSDTIGKQMVSVTDILPDLESLILKEDELKRLKNGNTIQSPGSDNPQLLIFDESFVCLGVAYRKTNILHPRINLC